MSWTSGDIQRQFNLATGSYDKHAHVQRMMAERLMRSLAEWIYDHRASELRILEIGCGTGALTEMMLNEWPVSSITAIDISTAMVKTAEQRVLSRTMGLSNNTVRQPDRLCFIAADIESWAADAPAASFDLIVSSACFQWLKTPGQTLVHLNQLLRADGKLAFTTFGPDTFCELHQAFHEVYIAQGMEPQRHGMSFQSADEWLSMLHEARFGAIRHERSIHNETYVSPRQFLHSVKAVGASTSEATVSNGLGLRRLFADMYRVYEQKFSVTRGITATYDILLIQALR
ncbi:malonyl-ACP O-methyltransferase BioC [Paenibacillus spongiae]|uniref:Malonyl-[acyl-carrier protein] O-methyltransferase n=1 Tax=Paenibacillus spongiae TaxID=2909671 RepID=A0ABY5SIL7_9BACL|nr:malonyl-ACP O-methyltransferase BioC [Paenibacillus spongiae]UVI33275.1 malonyl-ACP O-methyltransferase BioC [Paenibacillus spongiae]